MSPPTRIASSSSFTSDGQGHRILLRGSTGRSSRRSPGGPTSVGGPASTPDPWDINRYRAAVSTEDDARSQMLEFLLREMDFHLDSLNGLRTALSTLVGLGATAVLAIAGLAFRDGREPPGTPAVWGSILLAAGLIVSLVTMWRIRGAVAWPEGDRLSEEQPGSAIDLRERYLKEFKKKVGDVRNKARHYDITYLVSLALLAGAIALWVLTLAQTNPPSQQPANTPTTMTPAAARPQPSAEPSTSQQPPTAPSSAATPPPTPNPN